MADGVYRLAERLGAGLLRALAVDVRVRGVDRIAASGPVILAANHVSYPDFVFVQQGARERGRRVRFMCRHDIWGPRPIGWAMDAMQHIPVDRAAPAGAYLTARRLLREGEAICTFPEAGISYSYTVRGLMRGTAALARELDVPVVPVAIWGAQRIYGVGRPDTRGKEPPPDLTRGRIVDVRFGEPIPPGDDLDAWTRDLGARLHTMVEELQLLPDHRPRPGEYAPWYPRHLGGHAPCRVEAARYDNLPLRAMVPTWGPSVGASGASDAAAAEVRG